MHNALSESAIKKGLGSKPGIPTRIPPGMHISDIVAGTPKPRHATN
jgi:hypothetical protein